MNNRNLLSSRQRSVDVFVCVLCVQTIRCNKLMHRICLVVCAGSLSLSLSLVSCRFIETDKNANTHTHTPVIGRINSSVCLSDAIFTVELLHSCSRRKKHLSLIVWLWVYMLTFWLFKLIYYTMLVTSTHTHTLVHNMFEFFHLPAYVYYNL